jgi:hypothetical protein
LTIDPTEFSGHDFYILTGDDVVGQSGLSFSIAAVNPSWVFRATTDSGDAPVGGERITTGRQIGGDNTTH